MLKLIYFWVNDAGNPPSFCRRKLHMELLWLNKQFKQFPPVTGGFPSQTANNAIIIQNNFGPTEKKLILCDMFLSHCSWAHANRTSIAK